MFLNIFIFSGDVSSKIYLQQSINEDISSTLKFNIQLFFQYNIFLTYSIEQILFTPVFTTVQLQYLKHNWYELLCQLFISLIISLTYLLIQLSILQYNAESKRKDIQLMKVIHDIKNPILSIKQIVNNEDYESSCLDLKFENQVKEEKSDVDDSSRKETSVQFDDRRSSIVQFDDRRSSMGCQSNQEKITRNGTVSHARRLSSVLLNKFCNKIEDTHQSRKGSIRSLRKFGDTTINNGLNQVNQNTIEHIQRIQKQVNTEIEDIEEMIENLKTQFKSVNKMNFKEETKEVNSVQFMESLKNTHMKLAESAKNLLLMTIKAGFPKTLELQKSLVKRILNNFVSNSLKHTKNGSVEIIFRIISRDALKEYESYQQLGADLLESNQQLCFEVQDNGSGIADDKMSLIFKDNISDQSGNNWDGCGLGLPICEKLAIAIKARIYYNSIKGKQTKFSILFNQDNQVIDKICIGQGQIDNINNSLKIDEDKILLNDILIEMDFRSTDTNNFDHKHLCNSILIAEDNKNILNRQIKYLDKHKISQVTFMNGSDCLSYIKDEINYNCSKCNDMILVTDLYMPQMDGQVLAKEIVKIDHEKKIRLILLSADEPSEEIKKIDIFDEIIVKPIQMSKFKDYYSYLKDKNKQINTLQIDKKIMRYKSHGIETNFEIQLEHSKEKLLTKEKM